MDGSNSQQDVPDTIIRDIVFDNHNQERRSWKFCNWKLPRLEVVFFCQITVVMFIVVFSCVSLCLSKKCEETTLWVAILSSAIGYILPNPKL